MLSTKHVLDAGQMCEVCHLTDSYHSTFVYMSIYCLVPGGQGGLGPRGAAVPVLMEGETSSSGDHCEHLQPRRDAAGPAVVAQPGAVGSLSSKGQQV